VASTGVTFHTFGDRAAAAGLRRTDVIVAVDGWRVRNVSQYLAASRFVHDEKMTFLVWRDGRYQDLSARVPERSMGTRLKDYRVR
jgi:S1-C subfamily serine protease